MLWGPYTDPINNDNQLMNFTLSKLLIYYTFIKLYDIIPHCVTIIYNEFRRSHHNPNSGFWDQGQHFYGERVELKGDKQSELSSLCMRFPLC